MMPLYLIRSPKGGLAIVAASSDIDAKLDLHAHCHGVDLDEVTLTELALDVSAEGVIEVNSFKDGSVLV